ncbi:MAG: hypothetical protein V7K21_11065 [Nostoc sp.]|uniref:hypothetical protein n=1 Tax=Nostoc sp. TaxID=1180 RepID=UPI002FFC7F64
MYATQSDLSLNLSFKPALLQGVSTPLDASRLKSGNHARQLLRETLIALGVSPNPIRERLAPREKTGLPTFLRRSKRSHATGFTLR